MAKGLNFRNFTQPTLPITMNDKDGTLFTVITPTVELVERLEANKEAINEVFERGDQSTIDAVWDLAARLISCNQECCTVTAEDLKGRYRMTYRMLFLFFRAYGEFINEIESEKN